MPGVGLVQPTGDGHYQLFLPFSGADVVVPLLTRTPKVQRDKELAAKRAAMAAPARKRAPAVTVGGAPISAAPGVEGGIAKQLCSADFWSPAPVCDTRRTLSLLAQFEASVLRQDAREAVLGHVVPGLKQPTTTRRKSRRTGKTVVTQCKN